MILDTNVYSALQIGSVSAVQAISTATEIVLPTVVIAELRFGFLAGTQHEKNERLLQRFLAQDIVKIIEPTLQTTEHYAVLAAYCRKIGKALSHNDLWIAALAVEHELPLLTYDQDFLALESHLLDKLVVLSP